MLQNTLASEILPTSQAAANPPIWLADNLQKQNSAVSYRPDISFILRTDIGEGKLIFSGQGGRIDGQANPDLKVKLGDVIQITLINGDGAEHDLVLPDFNTRSDKVSRKGSCLASITLTKLNSSPCPVEKRFQ